MTIPLFIIAIVYSYQDGNLSWIVLSAIKMHCDIMVHYSQLRQYGQVNHKELYVKVGVPQKINE